MLELTAQRWVHADLFLPSSKGCPSLALIFWWWCVPLNLHALLSMMNNQSSCFTGIFPFNLCHMFYIITVFNLWLFKIENCNYINHLFISSSLFFFHGCAGSLQWLLQAAIHGYCLVLRMNKKKKKQSSREREGKK